LREREARLSGDGERERMSKSERDSGTVNEGVEELDEDSLILCRFHTES